MPWPRTHGSASCAPRSPACAAAGSDVATAKAAVEALAIYRHDSRVHERVIAAARERDDASFLREVERWMP